MLQYDPQRFLLSLCVTQRLWLIVALLRRDCFVTGRAESEGRTLDLSSQSLDYGTILKCAEWETSPEEGLWKTLTTTSKKRSSLKGKGRKNLGNGDSGVVKWDWLILPRERRLRDLTAACEPIKEASSRQRKVISVKRQCWHKKKWV